MKKAKKPTRKEFKTPEPKKKKKPTGPPEEKRCVAGRAAREDKYELFCLEYIKDENATRAALAVGYSESGASVEGCRLLANPKIKMRIIALKNERRARVMMEGDEILLEVGKLARSDIRDLFDKDGMLMPMHQWPDHVAVCVSSVETIEKRDRFGRLVGIVRKVRLWDKVKPQELIGKNKKKWTDVTEHQGDIGVHAVNSADVAKKVKEIEEDV